MGISWHLSPHEGTHHRCSGFSHVIYRVLQIPVIARADDSGSFKWNQDESESGVKKDKLSTRFCLRCSNWGHTDLLDYALFSQKVSTASLLLPQTASTTGRLGPSMSLLFGLLFPGAHIIEALKGLVSQGPFVDWQASHCKSQANTSSKPNVMFLRGDKEVVSKTV